MRWVCTTTMLVSIGCAGLDGAPSESPPAAVTKPAHAPAERSAAPGACRVRTEGPQGVSTTAHSYEDGRRVRSVHEGPQGVRQTLIEYDALGRRAKEVLIDGADLRTRSFGYDEGVLVETLVTDAAGTTIERQARIYGEGGKLRTRTIEQRGPEGLYLAASHALHYDDAGHFVYELETRTPLVGPTVVRSVSVEVDDVGRVRARRIDEGMTGTIDHVSLFAYTPTGKLSTMTRMQADQVSAVTRHEYDTDGRLVQTTIEDPGGSVHTTTTYDFGCWDTQA